MDLKKAITAAAKTGIVPFPALARSNDIETETTAPKEKADVLKGKK